MEQQFNRDTLLKKFATAENVLGKCLLESERNSSSNRDTLFQKFSVAENLVSFFWNLNRTAVSIVTPSCKSFLQLKHPR